MSTIPYYGPLWPVKEFGEVPTPQAPPGGVGYLSYNAFEGAAVGTVTLGGTPTTGDVVHTAINGHDVTISPTTGQSLTTVATNLAAAINADGTDSPLVTAVGGVGIVTITAKASGAVGMLSLTASATGGHTTATASGAELDLPSNVVVPTSTFSYGTANGPVTFYKDAPVQVSAAVKTALKAAALVK